MFVAALGSELDTDQVLNSWIRAVQSRDLRITGSRRERGISQLSFEHPAWPDAMCSHISASEGHCFIFDGILHYRSDLCRALELAAEQSESDPMLARLAAERWGEQVGHHLEGAFVVAAGNDQAITIANDCMGAQRLYFSQVGASLVFGTSLPVLMATPGVDNTVDGRALAQVLGALVPRGRTPFRKVRILPGGSTLTWSPGKLKVARWWKPTTEAVQIRGGASEVTEQLVGLFDDAVTQWLDRRDVVTATLSGGLDSTLSVCFAAKKLEQTKGVLRAFTSVPHPALVPESRRNWDASDWPYAQLVAEAFPNVVHRKVVTGFPCLVDNLAQIHRYAGAPVRNTSNVQWLARIASEAAGTGNPWVMTGLRGNYSVSGGRRMAALHALLLAGDWSRLGRELRRDGRPLWRSIASLIAFGLVGRRRSAMLSRRLFASYAPVPRKYFSAEMHEALDALIENLEGVDRTNCWKMAQFNLSFSADFRSQYGVELCDPTGDRRLMEVILRLPDSVFLEQGHDRALARKMGAGLVPDPIRLRTTRGEQSPDEASYFKIHGPSYRAAWKAVQHDAMACFVEPGVLEAQLDRLVAGQGNRSQAQFVHRCIDIGLWLKEANASFGSSQILFDSPAADDVDESPFA